MQFFNCRKHFIQNGLYLLPFTLRGRLNHVCGCTRCSFKLATLTMAQNIMIRSVVAQTLFEFRWLSLFLPFFFAISTADFEFLRVKRRPKLFIKVQKSLECCCTLVISYMRIIAFSMCAPGSRMFFGLQNNQDIF